MRPAVHDTVESFRAYTMRFFEAMGLHRPREAELAAVALTDGWTLQHSATPAEDDGARLRRALAALYVAFAHHDDEVAELEQTIAAVAKPDMDEGDAASTSA